MKEVFILAQKGFGSVSPNPLVGCIIVKDNVIVAEGYHQKFGEAHAEVNAIQNLPKEINPADCTLYVNLEPCSHHGKTPPCTDLIINKGFKKVVIANIDTNPLVAGKGIEKLKTAGIEVITSICQQEAKFLNRRFFTFHEKKRPYIILKWAQTADGFISKLPIPANRKENYISGEASQKLVHQMRAQEDAILVGKNTILNDNPQLTTRLVDGKNPVRIVIAKKLCYNANFYVFNTMAQTLVFNTTENKNQENLEWVKLNETTPILEQILHKLHSKNITSLLVEGGAETLNTFIKLKLYDEIRIFVNPNLHFKSGIKAPEISLNTDFQYIEQDEYHVQYV